MNPVSTQRLSNAVHRCQEEDVQVTPEALKVLTSMARETTLRYTLNSISCAQVLAAKRKSATVDVDDLKRSWSYFLDEARSVQWLKEQQGNLIEEEDVVSKAKAASTDVEMND